MPVKRFRRTQWLIDSDVQVRLSVRLASCLVSYIVLFCLIAMAEPLAVLVGFQVTDLSREAASRMIRDFSGTILAPLLFAVACMVLHGVLILHRLAGPVFRVRRAIGALFARDLTDRIHLRDHDYLVSLAESYNHASERIRSDMEKVEAELDAILAGDPDDTTKVHAERAGEILRHYRLQTGDVLMDDAADGADVTDGAETTADAGEQIPAR